RRHPALDQPAHHRFEQHLLAAEAVIERALRDAGAFRHRLDAGGAEAVAEEQGGGDVENAVGEQHRLLARGPPAAPARSMRNARPALGQCHVVPRLQLAHPRDSEPIRIETQPARVLCRIDAGGRPPICATSRPFLLAETAMLTIDLSGKRAVVAGGSRGIGRAIALAFAECGAAALSAAHDEIAARGVKAHAAVCDLADRDAIPSYIAAAAEALGGLDILVNNASGFGSTDDEAGWERSVSIDLLATVRASRAALPLLEAAGGGAIVNISSISGLR